tara:strand:- start:5741 stop:6409 length:669 start_codon:yes stop_codon:yes gene_type:complete
MATVNSNVKMAYSPPIQANVPPVQPVQTSIPPIPPAKQKQNSEILKHIGIYMYNSRFLMMYLVSMVLCVVIALMVSFFQTKNPIKKPHLIVLGILYCTIIYYTSFMTEELIPHNRKMSKMATLSLNMILLLAATSALVYVEIKPDSKTNTKSKIMYHLLLLAIFMIYVMGMYFMMSFSKSNILDYTILFLGSILTIVISVYPILKISGSDKKYGEALKDLFS